MLNPIVWASVIALNNVKMVLKILFASSLIILVLFLVSSYFLSMPLGLVLFFFTPEGVKVSQLYIKPPVELFITFDFYIPVAVNVGLVFLFLLGVYAICFGGAWMSRESLHKVVRKGFSRPITKLFNNNLFAIPVITSMLLTAIIVIYSIQESYGVPTGSLPKMDPFKLFFWLTYTPVLEEISFRISTIGVFLIVYLFWVGGDRVATLPLKQSLKILFWIPLCPDKAKGLLGVRTVKEFGIKAISLPEWIIIIITSVAFGLFHYLGGWGPGKITTTSLSGLVFGLAYLLYGAQAPILMHWFFNYYAYGYYLASDAYPVVSFIVFLIDSATIIVAVLGFLMFTGLLGAWVYRKWKRGAAPLVPPPPLPTPPPPPLIIRFCRRCGRVLSEDVKSCPYCGKAVEEKKKEDS